MPVLVEQRTSCIALPQPLPGIATCINDGAVFFFTLKEACR